MSKAWGTCAGCSEWTLHYIRTVRPFQDVTKDRIEYTCVDVANAAPDQIRWVPGKVTKGKRMLRECNTCGLQWWEILEQRTLTDEERWPK